MRFRHFRSNLMSRSLFRFALAPLVGVAVGAMLLIAGPAQSGNVTISDPSNVCSWSFAGGILTCNPASPNTLVCNPNATPSPLLLNSTATIAAGCSGASASATYVWAAGASNDPTCPGVPAAAAASPGQPSFQVTSANPLACTYVLTATDGTKTVSISGPAAVNWVSTLPFTCSFNPAPSTATVGTALPLTVTCQNADTSSPLSFAWTAGPGVATFASASPTSTGSNSVTLPSAGVWTITANVTNGATNSASPKAIVSASNPGNTNLCAPQGFAKTIYYKWDWAAFPSKIDTQSMTDMAGALGIGPNGILVIEFTPTEPHNPGTGTNPYPYMSHVDVTPYPGGAGRPTNVTLAISTAACDLNPPAPATGTSSSMSMPYGVGPVQIPWATGKPTAVSVMPGTTYYINVAPRENISATSIGTPTCSSSVVGVCDLRFSFFKPGQHY
jgi:hypothetical protein